LSSSTDVTIAYDDPDEDGWIVARILDVPGALSQGRTHEEARLNVLDALRTLQTADRHGLQRTPPMHIVWTGPQSQLATVPQHEDIGPGLTRAICKQLNIPLPN
jgi:predicted RNase H-like HicB family nuclease